MADEDVLGGAAADADADADPESDPDGGMGTLTMVAVVVGALGMAAFAAVQWKRRRDAAALQQSLSNSMFGAEEEATEGAEAAPEFKVNDKGELVSADGQAGEEEKSQADNTLDLSGYDPTVLDAWDDFQQGMQANKGPAENVEVMERVLPVLEEHLPGAHECVTTCFITLARNYASLERWDKCEKLCGRGADRLDTAQRGKQTFSMVQMMSLRGCAAFRQNRYDHAKECYQRCLDVLDELTHPSWRHVEVEKIHEFGCGGGLTTPYCDAQRLLTFSVSLPPPADAPSPPLMCRCFRWW